MRSRTYFISTLCVFGLAAAGCTQSGVSSSKNKAPEAIEGVQNPESPVDQSPSVVNNPVAEEQTNPIAEGPNTEPVGYEEPPIEVVETDPSEHTNAVPEGESAEGGDASDPLGAEGVSETDTMVGPGMNEPDTEGNGVGQVPDTGWLPATQQQPWASIGNIAAYPNSLPERPVALNAEATSWQPWTSGRGIAVHNGKLFVASSEADSLVVFDAATGKVERIISVGERPEQVVVHPTTGTAYVTVRWGGAVVAIPEGSSQVTHSVAVGAEPYGIALGRGADPKVLYVSISAENRVIALTTDLLSPISNVPVPRRPRGITVNTLGDVYVATQFGGPMKMTAHPLSGALVGMSELPLRNENPADVAMHQDVKIGKTVPTRSFAADTHPVTGAVYVAHVNANPGSIEQSVTELTNQKETTSTDCVTACKQTCKNSGGYGGTVCSNSCNTNCTTEVLTFPHIIRPIEPSVTAYDPDSDNHQPVEAAAPIKDQTTGEPYTALCDKPLDIAHHPTRSLLFVTCKGTDNVLVLNSNTADPMRSTVAEIKVGAAPIAVTFSPDGQYAYVKNSQPLPGQTSLTVSRVLLTAFDNMDSLSASQQAPTQGQFPKFPQVNSGKTLTNPIGLVHGKEIAYATDPLADVQVLLDPNDPTSLTSMVTGRRAFTFSRFPGLSEKGFFACATCHPDGTEDKLVWFVKDGPRQTPMLAGKIADTEPFNWVGTAETLQQNIANTVTRMGGTGLTDAQQDSLSVFIRDGLVPPPNPNVSPEGLTESQKAGKELFFHPALGCAECHGGKGMTDGQNWDVGTFTDLELTIHGQFNENALSLNTPSLKGLYYSAPYLHDGSALTIKDALNATSATMGVSMQLTGQMQQDLVNYLLTL